MKRALKTGGALGAWGYTIIEVMIFLIVSSTLLISTMALFSGKDEKTRFTQGVDRFDQKISDITNDVSTGYFASNSNFKCQPDPPVNPTTVTFSNTSVEQGKNTGCTFVGKLIEFSNTQYNVYTMVGLQDKSNLKDSGPKLLLDGPVNPGIIERHTTDAGLQVTKIINLQNGATLTGLAVVSDFGQTSAENNSVTGNAARVTLLGYTGGFTSTAKIDTDATMVALPAGAAACLQVEGGGRKAALLFGTSGQLSTEKLIDQWPAGC